MASTFILPPERLRPWEGEEASGPCQIVLSMDLEEHNRIEVAGRLEIASQLREHYRRRLEESTHWILEQLEEREIKCTFFVVAAIAKHNPGLIRAIHRAGHEIASHSWDHCRIDRLTPQMFRSDVRRSRDVLEQITSEAVVGYRAPTFSISRKTAWAIDVLVEEGYCYDSSIYPVRHDLYGEPQAPRSPFVAIGDSHRIIELPPATLKFLSTNIPMGGGGYFRIMPLSLIEKAISQVSAESPFSIATLYFHPWEFDPKQIRLSLGGLNWLRTYVGIHRSQSKLLALLDRYASGLFSRAKDVAGCLDPNRMPTFELQSAHRNGYATPMHATR